jgi:hypothetical protein
MKSYDPQQAAAQFPEDGWATAQASGATNGGCVRINLARVGDDMIGLQDSKQPEAGTMVYSRHEWLCFLDGVRNGEFDI